MLRSGVPKSGRSMSGEQEADDPEDVHVREQGYKPQHRDDLELQLVRLVRHALRQRVQAQEQVADRQHGDDQDDGHDRHQDVAFTGCLDERGHVVDRGRMLFCRHLGLQRVDPREPQ